MKNKGICFCLVVILKPHGSVVLRLSAVDRHSTIPHDSFASSSSASASMVVLAATWPI
jgi:hypothetical protein